MATERKDIVVAQIVFVGGPKVGKSAVLLKWRDNDFSIVYAQTIGVEFGSRVIEVEGKEVKLQVWDTAGDEKFVSITCDYHARAQVMCLMWDASEKDAMVKLESWFDRAKRSASGDAQFIFVRTKKDLDEKNDITLEKITEQKNQIKVFAGEDAIFFETSAKTGENVDVFLQRVAEAAYSILVPAEGPGRIERMSHSRAVRETHLKQENLDRVWLELHLASIKDKNSRTAMAIQQRLVPNEVYDVVYPQGEEIQEKFAPVLELLKELDSDETALKYKLCIFLTPESYSTRIVSERDQEVRQVILDVALKLFNLAKDVDVGCKGVEPTAGDLYGDLNREQIPSNVREILEKAYPSLCPNYAPGLLV